MEFKDKYTTDTKIKADKTGEEAKKEVLSSDAYAVGEMIQSLKNVLVTTIRSLAR